MAYIECFLLIRKNYGRKQKYGSSQAVMSHSEVPEGLHIIPVLFCF